MHARALPPHFVVFGLTPGHLPRQVFPQFPVAFATSAESLMLFLLEHVHLGESLFGVLTKLVDDFEALPL